MAYFGNDGVPDRGRILIANFELGGSAVPPEMCKSGRPCIVMQSNKLRRVGLVTVIPLSTTAPHTRMPYHHLMDHRSFRDLPLDYGGQGLERWAKCDYIATISLDRCTDPYSKPAYSARRYVKCRVIQADVLALEKCMLWALGIQPGNHVTAPPAAV